MSEETKVADTSVENPFDKEVAPEVETVDSVATPVEDGTKEVAEEAPVSTPASVDYSKYADMAETPTANEHRKFDYVAMSGAVEMKMIHDDKLGDIEKRMPAKAFKLFLTQERDENDMAKSEELELPLTVVPIKYRMVMEQRAGAKGETLVLKSSEFNGKTSDIVTINRFSSEGKVVETFGPMTVLDARNKFVDTEGKKVLRDKVHLYSLVGGELVRFVVKGTGLWEMESDLHKGKTAESQAKYPFLSRYLQEFAVTDPYFLYEMEVNAVYRDHGSIKYYRPTFTKGARISAETEVEVLAHLEDLHKYFGDMDEATKAYVPTATPATAEVPVATDAPTEPPVFEGEGVTADAPVDDGEY